MHDASPAPAARGIRKPLDGCGLAPSGHEGQVPVRALPSQAPPARRGLGATCGSKTSAAAARRIREEAVLKGKRRARAAGKAVRARALSSGIMAILRTASPGIQGILPSLQLGASAEVMKDDMWQPATHCEGARAKAAGARPSPRPCGAVRGLVALRALHLAVRLVEEVHAEGGGVHLPEGPIPLHVPIAMRRAGELGVQQEPCVGVAHHLVNDGEQARRHEVREEHDVGLHELHLVDEEVHEADPHALVHMPDLAASLAPARAWREEADDSAQKEHDLLGQSKQEEEKTHGDQILGHPRQGIRVVPTRTHDEMRARHRGRPDDERQHQEDIIQPRVKVPEHHDPREAERHKEDRQEIQDLGGERDDGEARRQDLQHDAEKERENGGLRPTADLRGEAVLEKRPDGALLSPLHDLRQLVLAGTRPACDEVTELLQVLADEHPPRKGREDDRGDHPGDHGDGYEGHRQPAAAALLCRQAGVDQVAERKVKGRAVVRLPIGDVNVPPSLVLVGGRAPGEEVPGDA
eukprot:CAMPEP_0170229348 /NCGR_PEP_ID=MMETSP0116_2-20130129/14398_1 /TAXON_ID=400756 /ORGANISM="Durinskia baltica, Strain CSIRO CS-38" /LENGTH=522 /DNA_ID=CAMNT_0010480099 /DNA_START=138 /DNA_END=1704 /DNA_ORIENTATION=+